MDNRKQVKRQQRQARINMNEAYAIFREAPEGSWEQEEARKLTLQFEVQYGKIRAHLSNTQSR